jgi:single-stranded-DNA-specific exonuclease
VRTLAKAWQLLPHDPPAVERLARTLPVSPIVAQLLLNRNLGEPDTARRFLTAALSGLHEPELLPGVCEAAERLYAAVRDGRRICVYGDYDVDGVTATAILLRVLRLLGAAVEFYVPHRLEEGYGLSTEALSRLADSGVHVVVTVDCGIASCAEADAARARDLELIITDHHEPRECLPDAAVLVHPRLGGGVYPFGGLSGSGVALKVAWALCKRVCAADKVTAPFRECLLDCVALAAVGTIADVVPLTDENRILVRHGLVRLHQHPDPGLKALLQSAGLDEKSALLAADVGYALAPRLNAAGRLGSARLAVELLTTMADQRAVELARFLEGQNKQRQLLERRMLMEAGAMIQEDGHGDRPALVLASTTWHAGLIGIVAGRLAETYGRPVLMIALHEDGEHGQGSARSVPGFLLHEALTECSDHLLSHGGHAAAAGFRLEARKVDDLRGHFCAVADRHFPAGLPAQPLVIDAEIPLAALTSGLVTALGQLEPFGSGNSQPVLLAGALQVVGSARRVGAGERHLSFRVRQQGKELRAIAFGMADRLDELMSAQGHCCLVFTPKFNEWQGRRSVELEVRDFQAGPFAELV